MDGVHDLGGKEGFGPIQISEADPAFPEAWEGRAYAMVQTVGDSGSTIDWFRNIVELLPPAAYLSEPYFQKWQFVQLIEMLQAGMLSMEEVMSGTAAQSGAPAKPRNLDEVLTRIREKTYSFERPAPAAPQFTVGQTVRTRRHITATHTRLPGYARDASGEIIAHHGAHVLPDQSARGIETAEHLYTVRFAASELWGAEAHPKDDVTLDLWESYFVQP